VSYKLIMKSWKVGVGAGAILLGAYLSLSFQDSMWLVIAGIVLAALGIGLLASK